MTRPPGVTKRGSREDTNRTTPRSTASKQPKPVIAATTSTQPTRTHPRRLALDHGQDEDLSSSATKTVHRLGSGVTPQGTQPADSSKVVTDSRVSPKLDAPGDHQQWSRNRTMRYAPSGSVAVSG